MAKDALSSLSWWLRDSWKAILLVLGLAAFAIAAGLWMTRNARMPAIEEQAEVVRFGAYHTEEGARPLVLVRMNDGRIVQLGVSRSQTRNCRVGSRIQLVRRGDTLNVHSSGCSPPPS